MEVEVLVNKIFVIVSLLKENEGVALFANKKKGFEKWLQVELCGLLSNCGNVLPEKNKIDIVFNDEWTISLKDRRTYFNKGRSNVLKNLNDLKKYLYNQYNKTCLVFLTFCPFGNKKKYDNEIDHGLKNNKRMYYKIDFNFNNSKYKNNNECSLWFVLG